MRVPVEQAVHLMHEASYGTLASQSAPMPGYPYATVVPNVLDERHCPLLLVSALAEHTRNMLADPRVSLSIVEPGARNVQDAARLTVVGEVERFAPTAAATARYLRYQPEAEQYLALDFMFFRVRPKRIRYIAGVGKMGWLEATEWETLPSLAPADEEALLTELAGQLPGSIRLMGVDRFGIDCEVDGVRRRLPLDPGQVGSTDLADQVRRQLLGR